MKEVLWPSYFSLLKRYNLLDTGTVKDLIGLDHPYPGKSGILSQTVTESPLKLHSEKSSAQSGSNIL